MLNSVGSNRQAKEVVDCLKKRRDRKEHLVLTVMRFAHDPQS